MAQLFEPGFRFGKYEILGLLGTGGMSDVYEAVDPTLGRHVAIKVLPPEFSRQDERVRRFEKEVRAVASLNHPGIVTIYEVASFDNYQYYTMSLVPNGDLKHKIRSGISARESVDVARQVAVALAHAHKHGLIHRDIKPENILFDINHRAIVADFGIAKAVDSDTHMTSTGMSIGTPHYMSPEQAQGMNKVDHRSDLYSLGVVLYEMLTGKVPFDAENTLGIAMKHVTEPAPPLPEKLAEYQPLISRLLSKSPTERYDTAEEFVAACDELLAQPEAVPAAPVRTARPTRETKATPPPKPKPAAKPKPQPKPQTGDQQGTKARPLPKQPPSRPTSGHQSEKIAFIVVGLGVVIVAVAALFYFVDFGDDNAGLPVASTTTEDPSDRQAAAQGNADSRDGEGVQDRGTNQPAINQPADDVAAGADDAADQSPEPPAESMVEVSRDDPPSTLSSAISETLDERVDTSSNAVVDSTDARTPEPANTEPTTPTELPSPVQQPAQDTRVADALTAAQAAVAANRLTRPADDNALLHYRRVLDLDPGNAQAMQGIQSVARSLANLAQTALATGDLDLAEQHLARAASISPDLPAIAQTREQIDRRRQELASRAAPETDSELGLTLQAIAGGSFDMGSAQGDADEQPVREVQIQPFMLSTTETTVGQFRQFVDETGYQTSAEQGEGCWYWVFGWRVSSRRSWQDPGFDQTPEHPVVCVSRNDADAYVDWLNEKTGKRHFLPTESQWEYAARVGTSLVTYWRSDAPVSACQYGNFSDIDRATEHGLEQSPDNIFQCQDGYIATAPVGRFRANPWQLSDMLGNVEEWTAGCWTPSYENAPADGSALRYTPCSYGVVRGGSWSALPENDRAPNRLRLDPSASYSHTGFRVARQAR